MMQYMYIVVQFGLGAFNMYYAEHLEHKVGIPVWIVACAPAALLGYNTTDKETAFLIIKGSGLCVIIVIVLIGTLIADCV